MYSAYRIWINTNIITIVNLVLFFRFLFPFWPLIFRKKNFFALILMCRYLLLTRCYLFLAQFFLKNPYKCSNLPITNHKIPAYIIIKKIIFFIKPRINSKPNQQIQLWKIHTLSVRWASYDRHFIHVLAWRTS